jgi:3'-phosphoadenosine 5'-phosphosulfate synthase
VKWRRQRWTRRATARAESSCRNHLGMATQAAFLAGFSQLAAQPGRDRAVGVAVAPAPGPARVAVAAVGSAKLGVKAGTSRTAAVARLGVRCRASLIEPDGGRLVDLVAPEEGGRRAALRREAAELPHRLRLGRVDKEWVHVLSEGWASPLQGFMREHEFLQALHFNAIRGQDGRMVNMSVPIVLSVGDAQRRAILADGATRVALVDERDRPIAVLSE